MDANEYIARLLALKEKMEEAPVNNINEAKFIQLAIQVGFSSDQAVIIFQRCINETDPKDEPQKSVTYH